MKLNYNLRTTALKYPKVHPEVPKVTLICVMLSYVECYVYVSTLSYVFQIKSLWKKKDSGVIIAVISSKEDKQVCYTLYNDAFQTLKPHQWLAGEVTNTVCIK